MGIGITVEQLSISIYFDNLDWTTDNTEELQNILDALPVWCDSNWLNVNLR